MTRGLLSRINIIHIINTYSLARKFSATYGPKFFFFLSMIKDVTCNLT